jgi:hypothetical protein
MRDTLAAVPDAAGVETGRQRALLRRGPAREGAQDRIGPERTRGADAFRHHEEGGGKAVALEDGQGVVVVVAPAVVEADRAGARRKRAARGEPLCDLAERQHPELGAQPRQVKGEGRGRHVHARLDEESSRRVRGQHAMVVQHRGPGAVEGRAQSRRPSGQTTELRPRAAQPSPQHRHLLATRAPRAGHPVATIPYRRRGDCT